VSSFVVHATIIREGVGKANFSTSLPIPKKINGEVVRKWSDSKMALEILAALVDLDVMSTHEFLGHMRLGRT
jgi:hypothetical protein